MWTVSGSELCGPWVAEFALLSNPFGSFKFFIGSEGNLRKCENVIKTFLRRPIRSDGEPTTNVLGGKEHVLLWEEEMEEMEDMEDMAAAVGGVVEALSADRCPVMKATNRMTSVRGSGRSKAGLCLRRR